MTGPDDDQGYYPEVVVLEPSDVLDLHGFNPKEIKKEGLSEYFLYTIEGTETIPNGWSKRLSNMLSTITGAT